MLPSLREDYLEAILLLQNRAEKSTGFIDIAAAMRLSEPEVISGLAELAAHGDITRTEDGRITLTDEGRRIGQRFVKKHETLQCFLTEILGMDRSLASNEACKIEHTISDETIDRLGNYIMAPETRASRMRCTPGESGEINRTLADCEEGDRIVVVSISGRSCAKRLLDLGVVPGQEIAIKRKLSNGSLVVQVKGCDVALSPEIASAIFVECSR